MDSRVPLTTARKQCDKIIYFVVQQLEAMKNTLAELEARNWQQEYAADGVNKKSKEEVSLQDAVDNLRAEKERLQKAVASLKSQLVQMEIGNLDAPNEGRVSADGRISIVDSGGNHENNQVAGDDCVSKNDVVYCVTQDCDVNSSQVTYTNEISRTTQVIKMPHNDDSDDDAMDSRGSIAARKSLQYDWSSPTSDDTPRSHDISTDDDDAMSILSISSVHVSSIKQQHRISKAGKSLMKRRRIMRTQHRMQSIHLFK